MKAQKYYTISTQLFKTKEGAKRKLLEYAKLNNYRDGSMVMEVTATFDVEVVEVIKLKKSKRKAK